MQGCSHQGSSAENTAQGARAPRAQCQQTAPAVQRTHRGCGAPRHRRRLGHPHGSPRPAAGACAHSGRGQAPSEAHVRGRASARLARGLRRCANNGALGKGTHTLVSRACRVRRAAKGRRKRRLGSGVLYHTSGSATWQWGGGCRWYNINWMGILQRACGTFESGGGGVRRRIFTEDRRTDVASLVADLYQESREVRVECRAQPLVG